MYHCYHSRLFYVNQINTFFPTFLASCSPDKFPSHHSLQRIDSPNLSCFFIFLCSGVQTCIVPHILPYIISLYVFLIRMATLLLVGTFGGGRLELRQAVLTELTVTVLAQFGNIPILLRQDGLRTLDVRFEFGNLRERKGKEEEVFL
jgi:hypothetical protein